MRLVERVGARPALVSDMDEPLGAAVGTGIEAIEARDFLRGETHDPRLAGGDLGRRPRDAARRPGSPQDAIVPRPSKRSNRARRTSASCS